MNEDFVVRFYFDTRQSERDAQKMANRLLGISQALRDMGVSTKYVDQAAAAMAKMGNAANVAAGKTQTLSAAAKRMAMDNNLVASAASGNANATARLAQLQGQAIEQNKRFDNSSKSVGNALRTVGYEALAVGAIIGQLGTRLTAAFTAGVTTAIDYERAIAGAWRTTNDGTLTINQLRDSLLGLAATLPVTVEELSEIATLGGQLGISGKGIEAFTSVVARLTATTNLTADAAGTALGRFQALLGVPSEEFENLASSILKVGVNSVATESQIVAISTQISSMADFAGFTADQVVGLAGALASVGAQPELSRGTITRVFTQMSKAISAGGSSLQSFARIAGVSSEEFASAFGTSRFSGIFQQFIRGLGAISETGGDATKELRELGITSVRDVPLMLRLAGAIETVDGAFADAASGYRDATELTEQYGIIAQTTAAKLQVLQNNFTNLIATIGSSTTGPIGGLADGLSYLLQILEQIVSSPVGSVISTLTLVLVGLAGVIATAAGAAAFAAGTYLLMSNALSSLVTSGVISTRVMDGFTAATTRAAGAARLLTGAVRLLGPALVGLLVVENAGGISDFLRELRGTSTDMYDTIKRIRSEAQGFNASDGLWNALVPPVGILSQSQKTLDSLKGFGEEFAGFVKNSRGAGVWSGFGDIEKLDKHIASLVQSGNLQEAQKLFNELKGEFLDMGGNQDVFNAAFVDSATALSQLSSEEREAAAATNEFAAAQQAAEDAAEALAAAIGLESVDALKNLQDALASGSEAFLGYGDIIKGIQDANKAWAESQSEALYGTKDRWTEFYDGVSVGADSFNASLESQIAKQAEWAENLGILSSRGATAFVSELAKLGPEGASLAASAVNMTTEELNRLEDNAKLAAFLSSEAFASTFTENIPAMMEAYNQGGIEAVRAFIEGTRETAPQAVKELTTINDVANQYFATNPLVAKIQADEAERQMNILRDRWARPVIVPIGINVAGNAGGQYTLNYQQARADGGYISGPGTGTSDSIPARLSNGEYVIRAASVRKYGTGLFDQLNRGVAKFASGGQVGARATASSGFTTGIMELGPKSLGAIREVARQEITTVLGTREEMVADYVNRGNAKRAYRGA